MANGSSMCSELVLRHKVQRSRRIEPNVSREFVAPFHAHEVRALRGRVWHILRLGPCSTPSLHPPVSPGNSSTTRTRTKPLTVRGRTKRRRDVMSAMSPGEQSTAGSRRRDVMSALLAVEVSFSGARRRDVMSANVGGRCESRWRLRRRYSRSSYRHHASVSILPAPHPRLFLHSRVTLPAHPLPSSLPLEPPIFSVQDTAMSAFLAAPDKLVSCNSGKGQHVRGDGEP